jgi:site-specific recombinase XerD
MKEFRAWSESTFQSYKKDVQAYEHYIWDAGLEPLLENARLHIIQKWIKMQLDNQVAIATVRRRIASLSSIYSFYKELGVVFSNPFKAIEVPFGEKGHHSSVMDLEQLKTIYKYLQQVKEQSPQVEVTVKVLMFTGLRNEALTTLRVKDIMFDKQLLRHDAGMVNSKHKLQFIPLPSKLLEILRTHIQKNHLHEEDSLLYGMKGQALSNKQLNRMINKICVELGWFEEKRVTPHGFRATLATLLDERGVDLDSIKYLLGHSHQENVHYYLRRDQRKINRLQYELTRIEKELEQSLQKEQKGEGEHENEPSVMTTSSTEPETRISEELLLQLLDTHPQLAISLIQKGYASIMEKR